MTTHKRSSVAVVILVITLILNKIKDEADLIRRYREVAIQPECDQAIEDIVNEGTIVSDEIEPPVRLNLDRVKTFSLDLKRKFKMNLTKYYVY